MINGVTKKLITALAMFTLLTGISAVSVAGTGNPMNRRMRGFMELGIGTASRHTLFDSHGSYGFAVFWEGGYMFDPHLGLETGVGYFRFNADDRNYGSTTVPILARISLPLGDRLSLLLKAGVAFIGDTGTTRTYGALGGGFNIAVTSKVDLGVEALSAAFLNYIVGTVTYYF
jgi:hypothetical protein